MGQNDYESTTLRALTSDITIEISSGSISGKKWGTGPLHCLALHGFMDNCNTFDPLFEALPAQFLEKFTIYAIDLPGHGLSCHKPISEMPTMDTSYLYDVCRIINKLGWTNIYFIGHSMGGNLALKYAGLYPKKVVSVLTIESVGCYLWSKDDDDGTDVIKGLTNFIDSQIYYEENSELMIGKSRRSYTWEQVLDKQIAGAKYFGSSLTEKEAKILLARNATFDYETDTYRFNRDLKANLVLTSGENREFSESILSRVEANICQVFCDNPPYYYAENGRASLSLGARKIYECMMEEQPKFLQRSSKSYEKVVVAGNHHVHLENPNVVLNILIQFFNQF